MKHVLFLSLAILGFVTINAQNTIHQTIAAGGGNSNQATSTGGSVSFTVGQITTNTLSADGISLAEGVQQTYKVSFPSSVNEQASKIKAQIFPNPTTDQLILSIEQNEFKNLNYQLMDLKGSILAQSRINNIHSSIDMSALPNGTYFVRILSQQNQLRTFKVIKQK